MGRRCRNQDSDTAGTIFEETRTPLRVWLAGASYVANHKLGVQRARLAADARYGVLSDRVSHVSPLSPNHGAARARETAWFGRSRRDLPGHHRSAVTCRWQRRKRHTAKVPAVQGEDIHEPSGFERIRLERVRGDSATSMIQLAHEGVLANRWALNNPISGGQAAAGRRVENTKPTKVVGCLVGYERMFI